MNKSSGLGFLRVLAPGALVALATAAAPGCSQAKDAVAGNCEIQATIDALGTAAGQLTTTADAMRLSLATACAKIAGDTPPTNPTDDQVTSECQAASTAITAGLQGGVTLSVVPGECHVNAQAQLGCEASCTGNASCTPGDVTVRCQPGDLSVECTGQCTGTLTCEGSASASVACDGKCDASCTGTCSGTCNGTCSGTCTVTNADGSCAGTCNGTCTGTCSATCNGTCSGSCVYDANASVTCNATARCQGTCSVQGTAPQCNGDLKPPSCQVDADCEAGCKGQANLDAQCTPPQIVFNGSVDATFAATLKENLPAILEVKSQLELAATSVQGIATGAGNVLANASAGCAAAIANVRGQLEGVAQASATINVSVQASASVSTSAGTG